MGKKLKKLKKVQKKKLITTLEPFIPEIVLKGIKKN